MNKTIKENQVMKEEYQELELEVVVFESQEIITSSGEGEEPLD